MEPHTSPRRDLCLCQPLFRRGIKNCFLIQRTLVFHHVFVASGTVSTNNFSRTAFLSMLSFAPTRISKFTRAGDLAWSARNLRWKLEFQRLSTLKIEVTSFDLGQRLTRETVCFWAGHIYLSRCSDHLVIWELFILRAVIRLLNHFFAPKLNSIFCRRNRASLDLPRSLRERPSRLRRSRSQFW